MPSAAALREQIESVLAVRIPAVLSVPPRSAPELLPTGIAEVDALLEGGLPLGGVTEVMGRASSGRSTLVLSVLAGITRQGAAAAYVDISDALDPLSAAAMGIDLGRLLWVRAGGSEEETSGSLPGTDKWPEEMRARSKEREDVKYGRGGSHPRTEMRGMEHAVERLFQTKASLENAEIPLVDYTPRCSESLRGRRVTRSQKIAATERSIDPRLPRSAKFLSLIHI